ncbi:podocalyxin isoform X2 [Sylvia atricapilla]|uniref:podocalyxin isoform X2 n=1 Tax=Sylvia atricapilla TaxID=48155 RepID=UPI0033966B0B
MRAAGLLLLLLLLGVNSQDDAYSADTGKNTTIASTATATTREIPITRENLTITEITTTTNISRTPETPTTVPPPPITVLTSSTKKEIIQPPVEATTAQSITTKTNLASSSPTAISPATVAGTAPTTLATALAAITILSHTSRQERTTHGATTPTASSSTLQQPNNVTATSGSTGTTAAAKSVTTQANSPPGAVGAAGTPSLTTQSQGSQPLGHLPKTTVTTTVARTDPPASSKECVIPPSQSATKQPPSSSSPAAQAPTLSTSSGSTGTPVTTPIGSPSLAATPMSPGSKDTGPEATTTTAPGADQSTQDVGSASGKPPSASQSPESAQPPDQTKSCGSDHQQSNIPYQNQLICNDQVQNTKPNIRLKEPRTCAGWKIACNNNSFFESFCSTAQHVFNASRDWCTVTLTAGQPPSQDWDVWVVLHHPLDSEEVLKELQDKKDKLEELGIVNMTSGKIVEDMTINDEFSTPLIITIITLAGSLLLIAAIYGCHQRFSQKKDQNIHPDVPGFDDGHVALIFNRLTEEMQTMENGYHDNPTLEVMETSSEMQEKKVNLNGELGDSWIVPLDTLMKEDLEEEEDTHL